jgi:hypothetical protein
MSWWTKYTSEQIDQAIENALAGPGGGAASLIHQASVTLTDQEFREAPVNGPIETVPGHADFLLRFALGVIEVDARAGAYADFEADSNVLFEYDTGNYGDNASLQVLPWTTMLGAAARTQATVLPYVFIDVLNNSRAFGVPSSADFRGTNIGVALFNNNAPYTGGHVDNRARFLTHFYVIDSDGVALTTAESGWDETTRTFA